MLPQPCHGLPLLPRLPHALGESRKGRWCGFGLCSVCAAAHGTLSCLARPESPTAGRAAQASCGTLARNQATLLAMPCILGGGPDQEAWDSYQTSTLCKGTRRSSLHCTYIHKPRASCRHHIPLHPCLTWYSFCTEGFSWLLRMVAASSME